MYCTPSENSEYEFKCAIAKELGVDMEDLHDLDADIYVCEAFNALRTQVDSEMCGKDFVLFERSVIKTEPVLADVDYEQFVYGRPGYWTGAISVAQRKSDGVYDVLMETGHRVNNTWKLVKIGEMKFAETPNPCELNEIVRQKFQMN